MSFTTEHTVYLDLEVHGVLIAQDLECLVTCTGSDTDIESMQVSTIDVADLNGGLPMRLRKAPEANCFEARLWDALWYAAEIAVEEPYCEAWREEFGAPKGYDRLTYKEAV